jgi:hypothetical protein
VTTRPPLRQRDNHTGRANCGAVVSLRGVAAFAAAFRPWAESQRLAPSGAQQRIDAHAVGATRRLGGARGSWRPTGPKALRPVARRHTGRQQPIAPRICERKALLRPRQGSQRRRVGVTCEQEPAPGQLPLGRASRQGDASAAAAVNPRARPCCLCDVRRRWAQKCCATSTSIEWLGPPRPLTARK